MARRSSADARAFVDDCYRRLLGRPADPAGLDTYVGMLAAGHDRADIVMQLATSDEYKARVLAAASPRRRSPDRYRLTVDLSGTSPFWAFDVRDDTDFDWLEAAIIDDGYYEHVGVWSLEPDDDKRVMGEILASLGPRRALELGLLVGHGVARASSTGGSMPRASRSAAWPTTTPHPRFATASTSATCCELALPTDYDLVFGLDVFEHLNPNRLAQYLAALRARVQPGALLFANIPTFGTDAEFGEVFPIYVAQWHDDIAAGRPFRVLHCDDDGYPMNGHLIWADTTWWVAQFAAAGFTREPTLERPVHERFGAHFDAHPARRSFYVFRVAR